MNPFQICGQLVVGTFPRLVRSALMREPRATSDHPSVASPDRCKVAAASSTGEAYERTSPWHEAAAGILAQDRLIQAEIERAKSALDRDGSEALELDRLGAIGDYSTQIAFRVRAAIGELDRSGRGAPTIRLSDLRSHLRTLRLLAEVLRSSALRDTASPDERSSDRNG